MQTTTTTWNCADCGWEFDESKGNDAIGISAGTDFAAIKGVQCPDCGNRHFEQKSSEEHTMTVKKQETVTTTEGPITRETNIQHLANTYPEAVIVMMERGLHCFGCHASAYDTVEAGSKGHGLPDEEIDKMVSEMNQIVATRQTAKASPQEIKKDVTLTEKAAKKLVELMAAEQKQGYGLRVQVVPGGCSGFSYGLDFDNKANKDDTVLDRHGVKVYIDAESMSQLTGATIDYVDGLQGSGFKVENPNAHSSCGCGKSFA
jgi:iron-sulfur cluster assembly protein